METVKTNKERQQNYRREYSRLKRAIGYEFFLEAVTIVYAIMEDRLVSFLHYAGIVTRDHTELKVNGAVYPYMRKLLGEGDNYAVRVKNITIKINLIKRLITMTEQEADRIDDEVEAYVKLSKRRGIAKTGYMHSLYLEIDRSLDKDKLMDTLEILENWLTQRNQLIHALMNKTPVSLKEVFWSI